MSRFQKILHAGEGKRLKAVQAIVPEVNAWEHEISGTSREALAATTPDEKRKQYDCDVIYGTNNEFGFDYLRDNMVVSVEDQVQRGMRNVGWSPHYFAVVDEVDSILIDEARTPLIISGRAADA